METGHVSLMVIFLPQLYTHYAIRLTSNQNKLLLLILIEKLRGKNLGTIKDSLHLFSMIISWLNLFLILFLVLRIRTIY